MSAAIQEQTVAGLSVKPSISISVSIAAKRNRQGIMRLPVFSCARPHDLRSAPAEDSAARDGIPEDQRLPHMRAIAASHAAPSAIMAT
jgi:hypothetical protein